MIVGARVAKKTKIIVTKHLQLSPSVKSDLMNLNLRLMSLPRPPKNFPVLSKGSSSAGLSRAAEKMKRSKKECLMNECNSFQNS